MADPIHQFEINKIFTIGHVGGHEIAFTNSSLFMVISVGLIGALLVGATASRSVVPGRMQSLAELSYEFVATTIRSTAGSEGMRFFPLVFSLFMFILVANLIGLIPYTFTVTSHIIITVSLALLVFLTVVIYGFAKNGLKFFKLFVPSGIPIFVLPLVVFIEVFSFFLRPISHSVRLFANMLAGHIALKVFASFIGLLAAGLGVVGGIARGAAARHGGRADRARAAGRVPAGLRVHHPHLHLSQRCDPPGPLSPSSIPHVHSKELSTWIRSPRSTSALVSPASAWAAPAVGVGLIFGQYLAAALRNPSAAQGQFGNLIFGFAVTEALGIFSLLIALLLLFVL